MERHWLRVAEKGDLQEVVIVQEPGRFGDGLLVRERIAGDQQRLRRDAEGEGGARDRLADCLGQSAEGSGSPRKVTCRRS